MFIERALLDALNAQREKYPILAVTGPRQSGKTTLLQHAFPDYEYVSLENRDIRERAESDPNGFLKKFSSKVILDEAQRAPILFSYLQTKTDADREMGQYILSGSQNFMLLESISQSLAGRVALFRLLPFTFPEMQKYGLLAEGWEEAAFRGFYPGIFDRDIASPVFYNNYIETYIERDVRNLIAVRDLRQFRLFMRRCAANAGQLLNLQTIAADCGISGPTAKAWLSVLESSYIVFLLSPYYRNFNKRITKSPKLFFYDTGVVCNLLEMSSPGDLDNYFQRGSLFENLIIAEMHKQTLHQGNRPAYYFWQDNHGNEVDLMWEHATQVNLLEIKSSSTFHADFLKNMNRFSGQPDVNLGNRYLIYAGDENFSFKDTSVHNWRQTNALLS